MEVQTAHAFTGRMCAASRWEESQRPDSLFTDPVAYKLAGSSGLKSPMGAWVMVPRTRFGDDFLRRHYHKKVNPARQVVLLGAGMDARAFRMEDVPEAVFFEVDQQTTFDVKEPLVKDEELLVKDRLVVATDFSNDGRYGLRSRNMPQWGQDLLAQGFDPAVPTVWLLEGLMMYLTVEDQKLVARTIGELSPPSGGSAVFFDAISATYVRNNINVAGAPFVGGSDDYAGMWRDYARFDRTLVHNFNGIEVDRRSRCLRVSQEAWAFCTPASLKGQNIVLFVESEQ